MKEPLVTFGRTLSVLAKAEPDMVRLVPFPHVVIENALQEEVYEALASRFPPPDLFLEGKRPTSNRYYWHEAIRVLTEGRLSRLWTDFVSYHVSREFLRDVLRVFAEAIDLTHPHVSCALPLCEWTPGVRYKDKDREISLECQLTYCSPVEEDSSRSRGPHLDREVALFGGLLYMRLPKDTSDGGDFVIYEARDATCDLPFDNGNHIADNLVKEFTVVPYKANTLVMFINSPLSIHGVSHRRRTCFPRLHVNFVGELSKPLFSLTKPPQPAHCN